MNPLFLFRKRLSPVRKLLLMHLAAGGKLIEYTATGNPLSFVTDVAKNLTQLLIPWTPTQSGTGDPSPTNIRPIIGVSGVNVTRCGVNLFDKDAVTHGYYIKSDGTVMQTAPGYDWCVTDYIPVIGNGKITYKSIGSTGTAPYSAWYTADKTLISTFKQQGGTSAAYTTTAPSTAKYVRFSILNIDTNLDNFIVALGESIGDYVAYAGATIPVAFPALGKNLLDINNAIIKNGYIGSENIVISDGSKLLVVPCKGGADYTITRKNETSRFRVATTSELLTSENLPSIDNVNYTATGCSLKELHIHTSENAKYLNVFFYRSASDADYDATLEQMMVEEGSTASAYQPFTNSILEGSLDLTAGVLKANRMMLTLTGESGWSVSGTNKFYVSINTLVTGDFVRSTSTDTQYSNMYQFGGISADGSSGVTTDKHFYLQRVAATSNPQWNRVWVYDTGYTLAEFKEAINTTPLQVTYPIAEQTWQLTPQQVQTLSNQTNVIWTDTNGTNTAKYLKKG